MFFQYTLYLNESLTDLVCRKGKEISFDKTLLISIQVIALITRFWKKKNNLNNISKQARDTSIHKKNKKPYPWPYPYSESSSKKSKALGRSQNIIAITRDEVDYRTE